MIKNKHFRNGIIALAGVGLISPNLDLTLSLIPIIGILIWIQVALFLRNENIKDRIIVLFHLSFGLTALGTVVLAAEYVIYDFPEIPFPSYGDILILAGYFGVAFSSLRIGEIRKHFSKLSNLTDAFLLFASIFALLLIFYSDYLLNPNFDSTRKIYSVSYFTANALLISGIFFMNVGIKKNSTAFWLLIMGFLGATIETLFVLKASNITFLDPIRLIPIGFLAYSMAMTSPNVKMFAKPVVLPADSRFYIWKISCIAIFSLLIASVNFPTLSAVYLLVGIAVTAGLTAKYKFAFSLNDELQSYNGIQEAFVKKLYTATRHEDIDNLLKNSLAELFSPSKPWIATSEKEYEMINLQTEKSLFKSNNDFAKIFINIEESSIDDKTHIAISQMVETAGLAKANFHIRKAIILEQNESRWNFLTQSSSEAVLLVNKENIIETFSPNANRIIGETRSIDFIEIFGVDIQETVNVEVEIKHNDKYFSVVGKATGGFGIKDASDFVVWVKDITNTVLSERFDSVTGLGNYNELERRSWPDKGTLVLVNIKNFRQYNDSYGFSIGNNILFLVGERIKDIFRSKESTSIFRGTNDEFIILIKDSHIPLESINTRMNTLCSETLAIFGGELLLDINANIAVVHFENQTLEEVVRNADTSLGYAKKQNPQSGQNVVLYEEKMQVNVKENLELGISLQKALEDPENSGLEIHFQPIIKVEDDSLYALEALTRWKKEDGSFIATPDVFVPLAERMGIAHKLDMFVAVEAATKIKELRKINPDVRMQMNISPVGLTGEHLHEMGSKIKSILGKAEGVVLEIIESTSNIDDLKPTFATLRDYGFGISIDDFGSGESNLHRILEFPATQVKFAGEFADSITSNIEFMSYQVASLKAKGFSTVVEKVENEEQLASFKQTGIDHVQGWIYARDMNFSDIQSWMMQENVMKIPS